jgi:hypothetical protein
MYDPKAALDAGFRVESFASFAAAFVEKSYRSRNSLLPDGFARHIGKGGNLIHVTPTSPTLLNSDKALLFSSVTFSPPRRFILVSALCGEPVEGAGPSDG